MGFRKNRRENVRHREDGMKEREKEREKVESLGTKEKKIIW